jgi:hypothetical protein
MAGIRVQKRKNVLMADQLIDILTADAYPAAERHFFRICGLDLRSTKHQRMWTEAKKIYDLISGSLQLRAVAADFVPDSLTGTRMTIGDTVFSCSAFEQLKADSIKRCYVYIITVGDIEIESDKITDLLNVDIWATAFIDAGRELLREKLARIAEASDSGVHISPSFGPGFYGMELEQIVNFFRLLDGASIGVALRENRIIIPLKTCTGMFLSLDSGGNMPPVTCEGCLGSAGGCRFCGSFAKRENCGNE